MSKNSEVLTEQEELKLIQKDFERWVKEVCRQNTQKYGLYSYSYINREVGAMWKAWLAATKLQIQRRTK